MGIKIKMQKNYENEKKKMNIVSIQIVIEKVMWYSERKTPFPENGTNIVIGHTHQDNYAGSHYIYRRYFLFLKNSGHTYCL